MNTKHGLLLVVIGLIGFTGISCAPLCYMQNRLTIIPSRVPNRMSVNGVYHRSSYDAYLAGGTYLTVVDGKPVLAVSNIAMDVSYKLTDDIRPGPENNRVAMIPHSNGWDCNTWMQEFIIPSFVRNDVMLFPVAFQNHTNRGTNLRIRAYTGSRPILASTYMRSCKEKLVMLPLDEDSPGRAGYLIEWDDKKGYTTLVIHVNRPQSPMKSGLYGNPVALVVEITEMYHAEPCTGLIP